MRAAVYEEFQGKVAAAVCVVVVLTAAAVCAVNVPDIGDGSATLDQINADLTQQASALGASISCYQSNHEGDLVDRIHQAKDQVIHNDALESCQFINRKGQGDEKQYQKTDQDGIGS